MATASPSTNMPPELLEQIFDRVVPPVWLFHRPGIHLPHTNSLDLYAMRQQKALLSVCKTWQAVASRYLYEDVFIRRPEQIFLFKRTLDQSPHLGLLVRSVHLCCITHPENNTTLAMALYDALDQRCHNVAAVTMAMAPADSTHVLGIPLISEYRFRSILQRLDIVHYGTEAAGYHLLFDTFLASHASTLTSLSIGIDSWQQECIMQAPLEFPCLTSLSLRIAEYGASKHLRSLAEWKLPCLQNFTLPYEEDPTAYRLRDAVELFLASHGKQLRYLHLKPPGTNLPPLDRPLLNLQKFVDLCPRLEHLAVQPCMQLPCTHPNIKWLDVWYFDGPYFLEVFDDGETVGLPSLEYLREYFLPNLQGLRRLAVQLHHLQDMPLKFPPYSWKEVFELRFGRFCIRCDGNGVISQDEELWSDGEDDEDAPKERYTWMETSDCEEDEEQSLSSFGEGDREVTSRLWDNETGDDSSELGGLEVEEDVASGDETEEYNYSNECCSCCDSDCDGRPASPSSYDSDWTDTLSIQDLVD